VAAKVHQQSLKVNMNSVHHERIEVSCNGRHRNPLSVAGFALAVVMSSVAFGQNVQSEYLPGIDFSKYHTYQWVTTRPHPNPKIDAEIKHSIDSQLTARGLTKTDNRADLAADYHVAISQQEKWPSFRYNELTPDVPVTVYAGTLGIVIKDLVLNQIVWSGRASKAFDPSSTPRNKQQILDKAVQALLRGFPPKQPR
jgi:hypothetical protein